MGWGKVMGAFRDKCIQTFPVQYGQGQGTGGTNRAQWEWERLPNGRASLVALLVKNLPAIQETWLNPWVGTIPWRRDKPSMVGVGNTS